MPSMFIILPTFRKVTLTVLFIAFLSPLFAQSDSPVLVQSDQDLDSVNSVVTSQTIDLLLQERMQRFKDSVAQESMRLQIENTTQSMLRMELEMQLRERQVEDSLKLMRLKMQIQQNKATTVGYPVVLNGDTLRTLYTNYGSLTPADRAKLSVERMKNAAKSFATKTDSLVLVANESSLEVTYQGVVLTTITPTDALWEDIELHTLAQQVAATTQRSIIEYKKQHGILSVLRQIGLSLLVIVATVILIVLVNRSFKAHVSRFLLGKKGVLFKGWSIKGYQVMDAKQQIGMVVFGVKIVRRLLTLLILYIALPILFSIFPVTRSLAETLFGWIWEPTKAIMLGILQYLPNLFVILVIWFTMRYVIKGIRFIMSEIENGHIKIKGFYPDWAPATFSVMRLLLYAFTFVLIFNYLPYSDSRIFQGVSVFVGLIFSFGSSAAIGNMVAGLVITYMRPFKIGDHIKIGDITGDVLEKTPVVTRIKTHKQEVVTIPNATVLSSSVVNYSTSASESQGIIFHVTITIGYDVPWRLVHEMMITAATRSNYVLKTPAPFVLQTSLDDFYVSYQLCAYSKNPEKQSTIYSQLHQNIQDVFNEHGVEIMSPHYRAGRDGNCTTIPEAYRPAEYTAPPFFVKQQK